MLAEEGGGLGSANITQSFFRNLLCAGLCYVAVLLTGKGNLRRSNHLHPRIRECMLETGLHSYAWHICLFYAHTLLPRETFQTLGTIQEKGLHLVPTHWAWKVIWLRTGLWYNLNFWTSSHGRRQYFPLGYTVSQWMTWYFIWCTLFLAYANSHNIGLALNDSPFISASLHNISASGFCPVSPSPAALLASPFCTFSLSLISPFPTSSLLTIYFCFILCYVRFLSDTHVSRLNCNSKFVKVMVSDLMIGLSMFFSPLCNHSLKYFCVKLQPTSCRMLSFVI